MMIARFRAVGWVAGCAAAALCCYLAAQRVASERLALGKVEREIAQLHLDNMRLETEIRTRSRPGQLERWNSAMFRLGAPAPSQFFDSGVRLAAFVEGRLPLDPRIVASKGAVDLVAYRPPAGAAAAPQVQPAAVPVPAAPRPLAAKPVQTVSVTQGTPATSMLHQATFVRAKPDRLAAPTAVPIVKVALVVEPVRAPRLAGILDDAPVRAARPAKTGKPLSLLPDDLGGLVAAERKAKRKGGER